MKGVIKTFVPEKKFGFIKGDDGKDYFFHLASFKQQLEQEKICDEAVVDFEPSATKKGYRAENCSLANAVDVLTYTVPDRVLTTKGDSLRGWDVVEMGEWIVCGSSRESPDSAKADLIKNAERVGANGLIGVEYYKTTDSEQGTGHGMYYFSVHNFRARTATVAKKSHQGEWLRDELKGLNRRAQSEKSRLLELHNTEKRRLNIVRLITIAMLVCTSVVLDNGWLVIVMIMTLPIYIRILFMQANRYDLWLLPTN